MLAVELARVRNGDNTVARLVACMVARADEITELLVYYVAANARTGRKTLGRPSKQMQRGLAEAFNRLDAYQLAKYDWAGVARLRDELFLVHPSAKNAA